jgi:hypothetical protein
MIQIILANDAIKAWSSSGVYAVNKNSATGFGT